MVKQSKVFRKFITMLLAVLVIISSVSVIPMTASASTLTQTAKKYDIAVVFDNSGSMYTKGSVAWCRAKYAMEIFASMLNYENGDKLTVFPMWEVTTDGSKPSSGGSYAPFEVRGKDDIDKISNLFSVVAAGTPFEPVEEAKNYLSGSDATDKWLIVLTDGLINMEKRSSASETTIDLQDRLPKMASNGIKVQYLGIGNAMDLKADVDNGFYAKKSTDASLKDDLIDICNSIFQRSVLPKNRLSGQKLELDLSMGNLIVFAQGSDAKIVSLKDSGGNPMNVALDSGQRKYSEIAAAKYPDAGVDRSLAGQVVKFTNCPKGTYTLDYSGADAISIFYEPNVDIVISLMNDDDVVVDPFKDEIPAGEYSITSKLVDPATGEDVTNHELMGKDVKFTTYVKNGDEEKTYENGADFELRPDEATEVYVEATYLKDFTISTKGDEKAFPLSINVKDPEPKFEISADVQQPQDWYKTKDHENWKPIKVLMTIDGQPLTEEQMARTQLSISSEKNAAFRYEAVPGESAYYIYVGSNENGEYAEPETGKYNLKVNATYIDEYGKEIAAKEAEAKFEVEIYDKFWRWLLWIIIIAALIIATIIILNTPAYPNKVYLEVPKRKSTYVVTRSSNAYALSTSTYPGELRCIAKPGSPLRQRGKRNARFYAKDIRAKGNVQWYEINSKRFTKGKGGKYVNDAGKTLSELKPPVILRDGTEIIWQTTLGKRTGRVRINRK